MPNQILTIETDGISLPVNVNGNIILDYKEHIKLMSSLEMASVGLSQWKSEIAGIHIYRDEVDSILKWVDEDLSKQDERVSVVIGNAGTGKSVIMEDVYNSLIEKDYPVLGIKLDQINFHSTKELNQEVGLADGLSIVSVFQKLNENYKRSVLLIDQIDALSMSLSTDRSAMNVANKLVQQISSLPNVRIVISCRRFDLDYDYTLQEYKRYKKFSVSDLPAKEVERVLSKMGIDSKDISERVWKFLSVPINLYLFSMVKDTSFGKVEQLTLQELYDELWKKIVIQSKDSHNVNICLSEIVNRMYDDQTLTVDRRAFENQFAQQISYLLSEGFLVESGSNGIQFLHQSLFDYTYAREFYDSGRSLIKELEGEHQGLFVRSRVRQVLLYLREVSTKQYLETLNDILFKTKYNGVPIIRFHVKMLVLNAIGFCEGMTEEEKHFFLDKVLANDDFGPIFVDSVYSRDWFHIISSNSRYSNQVLEDDDASIKLMMSMCNNNFSRDEDMVEDYLDRLLQNPSLKIKDAIFNLICFIGRYGHNGRHIIDIFRTVKPKDCMPKASNFLEYAMDEDADFVAKELEVRIATLVSSIKERAYGNPKLDYEEDRILDKLKNKYPDIAYKVCLDAIHMVFDKTLFKYENERCSSSWKFFSYKRNEGLIGDGVSEMLDFVLDMIERYAKENSDGIRKQLHELCNSNRNVDLLIAIVGYTANPVKYKDEIFGIFINTEWLQSAIDYSSILDFYIKKLFRASFMIFDKEGQRQILDSLYNTHPKWETTLFKYHEQYDHPLTRKGKSFGEFIEFLEDNEREYVKECFPDMYQKYNAVKEKYTYLTTDEPHKTEFRSGWIGVEKSAYDNMTDEQWLQLMRKYKDNRFDAGFTKPTMTGIAMQFKSKVQANPVRFANVILEANKNPQINLEYIMSGFDGLTDTNMDINIEKVHEVFSVIAERFEGDINKYGSATLCSFLRSLRFFLKKKSMPKDVFNFICRAVVETKEDEDANDENDTQPYNTGINRARGIAGQLLVECSILGNDYSEGIFSTLESIAMTASITTRAAILLEMARLNSLDLDRSLNLYIMLLHDYQANLLAIPLHNLNPLIYYINYGFEKLIPIFKEAIKRPMCHKTITTLLWIAYIRGYKGAEDLFSQIIKASSTAAISFFQSVSNYHKDVPLDKSLKYLLNMTSSNDEEILKKVDIVYNGFESWSDEELETFTDAFVHGNCCKYATHGFYECLSSYTKEKPRKVLGWIIETYRKKEENEDKQNEVFDLQHILEILTIAYNGVRKYYPNDKLVEEAMDIMDEILADSNRRLYLNEFLSELDKR